MKSNEKQILIGREREREELERCLNSNRSEFIAVYGRRRVGKTFLIENHFNQTFSFWYVGRRNISTRNQLRLFAKCLSKYSGYEEEKFEDWFDAFDALQSYLESLPENKRKVIFIDEMPWIDKKRSVFVEALESFWNGWAMRRGDIVFISTGSATSWMRDKLLHNKGGLHSRITCQMHIAPFSLAETEAYLASNGIEWDRYQILQSYMILGGVPFYYSLLNPHLSLVENIDEMFFRPDGQMRIEFDELYSALFQHADKYVEVVKVLSTHRYGLTFKEISKILKYEGSPMTRILKNLEKCDFIERWSQYGNKKREEVFLLTDYYTLFYYKFITSDSSKDDRWWSKNFDSPAVSSWMGISFEMICRRHHKEIKSALGLDVVSTTISSWHSRPDTQKELSGAQIDMIIDRADRIIHLCEIKFALEEYILTKEYENKIRSRMGLFRTISKTKKTLVNTFVTTYGVANSKNKSIVHSEVTMDDLFK